MVDEPENAQDDAYEAVDPEDLWDSDAPAGVPVNRNVVLGAIGVVVVLVLAFVLFSGGGDDDGGKSGQATTTAGGAAAGKTTQITSQRAPYSGTIVPTTLPPGAVLTGCGDWDTAFSYPPETQAEGVYIWSDFEGWHLRLAGSSVPTLTGSITGQYAPVLKSPATAEGVEVKTDEVGKRLTFTLTAGEQPVGFDFSAGCDQKEFTFDLSSGGATVPFDKIHLGSRGIVKEFPLVARRTIPVPK